MLGHKRVPSREGGIEIVVEELGVRMAARGHCVTCYNRMGNHVSGREFSARPLREYKGIRLKRIFTINRMGWAAMTSSVIGSICAALGPYDVVHYHAEGPCVLIALPRLFRKRCIATIHGLDHQRPKWGRAARFYIILGERAAARWADEIIVLNPEIKRYFKQQYNRETVLIPNGVSRPAARPAELIRQKFGLEKDGYLLFLGRIVPEKGIRYLIEAYQQMNTPKKLVIAGGASDSRGFMMEMQALAAGNPNILFTGFVQGRMLEELYSNAYVYTLPSDVEGMPLSLLEAMSYGNCCLVSRIGGCADVVGNQAVIFEPGNVPELREKLQMLCDRPDVVERYRAQAADYICGKYSWDDVVDRTLALYRR